MSSKERKSKVKIGIPYAVSKTLFLFYEVLVSAYSTFLKSSKVLILDSLLKK